MTISVVMQSQVIYKDCPIGLFIFEGTLCVKTKDSGSYAILDGRKISPPDDCEIVPCYCEGGSKCIPMTNETTKGTFDGWKETTHPSYGLLNFSRVHSSGANALFGSSIKHRNPILMTISHATIDRGLNKDWYHSRGRIVEIEMSQSQFADAITSLNQGEGVPCTILFTERDGRIPECNFVNKTEQFSNEFRERLDKTELKLDEFIKEIQNIFDTKKSISKSDRENILNILKQTKMNVSDNAAYIYDSFAEQMDKTIQESKGEIESFMQNKIQSFASAVISGKSLDGLQMLEQMENPIEVE